MINIRQSTYREKIFIVWEVWEPGLIGPVIPSVSVEAYDGAKLLTSKLGNTKEEEEPGPAFHFQVRHSMT